MKLVGLDLISVLDAAAASAPLLAISWSVSPQSLEQLTLARPKFSRRAPGRWRGIRTSLGLWAVVCGAAVVALHNAASDVGPRAGAYRSGIAATVLFALAAAIAARRRIADALPPVVSLGVFHLHLRRNPPSQNFSRTQSTSWSIKPRTWQRMHITVAITAMLPLWWHCDLGRASGADRLLKIGALLLLASGFLGVAITDLSRWRLLSPKFSPRLSAGLLEGLLTVHRGLVLLVLLLITIHVLAVLYYAGL